MNKYSLFIWGRQTGEQVIGKQPEGAPNSAWGSSPGSLLEMTTKPSLRGLTEVGCKMGTRVKKRGSCGRNRTEGNVTGRAEHSGNCQGD